MSNTTALAMVFNLLEAHRKAGDGLTDHNQLPKLVLGVTFNERDSRFMPSRPTVSRRA